jgi:hypothetical protein
VISDTGQSITLQCRGWRQRISANGGGGLNFDSSPLVTVSAEQAKHVGDEENQQYCFLPSTNPELALRTGRSEWIEPRLRFTFIHAQPDFFKAVFMSRR